MNIETVELRDEQSGALARVLVGRGFNCDRFSVLDDGQPCELLWSAPGFERGEARDSSSGIPILFPFAGRIRGNSFTFDGRTYPLDPGDAFGNAIHGFVMGRPWEVIDKTPSRVVGRFQASRVDPSLSRHWPADFTLTATYELVGNNLRMVFEVGNPDPRVLPFWLGLHPYFRLPLVLGGQADRCLVRVPAKKYWPLENLLPEGTPVATDASRRLDHARPFSELSLDDVYVDVTFDHGVGKASIFDPAAGKTLEIRFDEHFNTCVVYTPPHREAICIEPYTAVPDALTLKARPHDGVGVLEPGDTFTAAMEIGLHDAI